MPLPVLCALYPVPSMRISLICTVRDEADNIAALLDSMLAQTLMAVLDHLDDGRAAEVEAARSCATSAALSSCTWNSPSR